VREPVYFRDDAARRYVPLTRELCERINDGSLAPVSRSARPLTTLGEASKESTFGRTDMTILRALITGLFLATMLVVVAAQAEEQNRPAPAAPTVGDPQKAEGCMPGGGCCGNCGAAAETEHKPEAAKDSAAGECPCKKRMKQMQKEAS
jgi:hypothetical protein